MTRILEARHDSRGVIFRWLALALFCCNSGSVLASSIDRQRVLEAMASNGVPGVAIAVVRSGSVDVLTLGSASPRTDVPIAAGTAFEAASLSKTVFATMFMSAVTEGRFSLDEDLAATRAARRVTNQDWYGELTPRLILSHQSGLPNWSGDARDPERTDPLEFESEPGTGYGYSGEGYELLHAHVVATLGRSLEDWLDDYRDRFGMDASHYAFETVPPDAAVATGGTPESYRSIEVTPFGLAAASLITSADDYGSFLRYLLATPDLLADLTVPQVIVESGDIGTLSWGLGWGLLERPDGSRIAFHWGDNWQFKAFVAIDTANETGIVYFANGADGLRLIDTIVEPVVGDLSMVRDGLGYEED